MRYADYHTHSAFDEIRLGETVYWPGTNQIFNTAGDELPLRPQSLIVLRHLAAHLGTLVTRNALIAKVWPDVAVTDDSLTQCIADIRKILNDHDRKILKTIPKQGYVLHGDPAVVTKPNPNFPQFAKTETQISKKVALAVHGHGETLQNVVKKLPFALHPRYTSSNATSGLILVYYEPQLALHAAMNITNLAKVAIAVNYTDGDGSEAQALLDVAQPGAVVVSQDICAILTPQAEFIFHDLGDVPTLEVVRKSCSSHITQHNVEHEVSAQLDARDVLPTLAILPFSPQTQATDTILGVFLADEIATAISRSEDVHVISRLSTGSMGNHEGRLRDIGALLNADFVMSGTFLQKNSKVFVTIEFSETETEHVLWSERMELEISPLLHEIENINLIIAKIRKAILLNEVRRVQSQPLHDLKLFSVMHGAVGLMHRLSLKEFLLARTYLEYVINKAPNHPAPLAWLARWHVLRTVQGWTEDVKQEARKALDLTARALDIDPDHTLALVCEGQVLVNLAHRLDEAQDRYDAALLTNPNDAQGRALRGMLMSFMDRGAEGKRDTEHALHLAPRDPHRFIFLTQAAAANITAEDYPRAVELARESLRLNKTHISTLRTLAIAQVGAGDHQDALKTATNLLTLQPDLRVSHWLKNSPGSEYKIAQSAAEKLRRIGIPN